MRSRSNYVIPLVSKPARKLSACAWTFSFHGLVSLTAVLCLSGLCTNFPFASSFWSIFSLEMSLLNLSTFFLDSDIAILILLSWIFLSIVIFPWRSFHLTPFMYFMFHVSPYQACFLFPWMMLLLRMLQMLFATLLLSNSTHPSVYILDFFFDSGPSASKNRNSSICMSPYLTKLASEVLHQLRHVLSKIPTWAKWKHDATHSFGIAYENATMNQTSFKFMDYLTREFETFLYECIATCK